MRCLVCMTSLSVSKIGIYTAAGRRKAALLPILGCRKLVECVLLYPFRWFFAFFALPLRFTRAWHSVTVSKRREGGRHSIHRRESGLIRRCLAATTSKGLCVHLRVWWQDLAFGRKGSSHTLSTRARCVLQVVCRKAHWTSVRLVSIAA